MKVSVPPVWAFSPPASDAAGAEDDVAGAGCWVQAASVRARTTAKAMLLRGKRTTPLADCGAATLLRPGQTRPAEAKQRRCLATAYEREGKWVQRPGRAAGLPLGTRSRVPR